jgi:hypothetical protein
MKFLLLITLLQYTKAQENFAFVSTLTSENFILAARVLGKKPSICSQKPNV